MRGVALAFVLVCTSNPNECPTFGEYACRDDPDYGGPYGYPGGCAFVEICMSNSFDRSSWEWTPVACATDGACQGVPNAVCEHGTCVCK